MDTTAVQVEPAASHSEKIELPSAPFFSIDSETTLDIDDAISIERATEGFLIRVAIANASAHVRIGSVEDIEARRRVATAYAGQKIVRRMLPRRISEEMGSLVQGRDRKAIVFEMLLSETLEVLRFTPSAKKIQVQHRLSYDAIPGILENSEHPLNASLALAASVARGLLQNRRNRGALARYDLLMMLVTDEEGNVRQLRSTAETIGYIIVQEMMILTNGVCSAYLIEHNVPCVFRNHEAKVAAPPAREVAEDIGQWFVVGLPEREVIRQRLDMIAGKAKYEPVCRGHYALNLSAYGHFTSPLRRYPDLLNQRQFFAHLTGKDLPYSQEALVEITTGMNEVIVERDAERGATFKASVARAGMRAVEKGTLAAVPDHELCAAIKGCCRMDEFPSEMTDELVRRCQAKELTDKAIVCILFEVDSRKIPIQARESVLSWIDVNPGKAVSLCSIGKTLGVFTAMESDAVPFKGQGFQWKITATFDDAAHEVYGYGTRKKDAEQSAARLLVAAKIGVEVQGTPEALGAGASVPADTNEVAPQPTGNNPKGALLELCAHRKWKPPVFDVTGSGPSHAPRFSGTAALDAAGDPLEVSVENCLSKKHAEALASEKLLGLLSGATANKTDTPQASAPSAAEMLEAASTSDNPVGALQEVAQKLGVQLPEYSIRQAPKATPWFLCELVTHHDGTKVHAGDGSNKQLAKMAAAKAALAAYRTPPP